MDPVVVNSGARALRTLPSAATTHRLARSQSKITELIDHAQQHVTLAMRLFDSDDASGCDTDTDHVDVGWTKGTDGWLCATMKPSLLKRMLARKKQRLARLADLSRTHRDDARYERLQHGYHAVTEHLRATELARHDLEDALTTFKQHAAAMEATLPPDSPRNSSVMTTSLHACFAQAADIVDDLLTVLTNDVAGQTQSKMRQLKTFKASLERRDQVQADTESARQQLAEFLRLKAKKRSPIPGAYDLELAQRKHEYHSLRRRLAAITSALEHVFQFHSHLDQCIVDPEMATTHRQLTRFFEKHARVFENNVK